jgi:hypothetical protein
MFIYDKIPNDCVQDVIKIKGLPSAFFQDMPRDVKDVCKGLERENNFYSSHAHSLIGNNGVRKFARSLYKYLECHDAIKYSVNDTLQMACVGTPKPAEPGKYPKSVKDGVWRIKDIGPYYQLDSGRIYIPMRHQQAFLHTKGYVPSTVASILRDYAYYATKCEDKNRKKLLKELETLLSYQVITTPEYIEYVSKLQNIKTKYSDVSM